MCPKPPMITEKQIEKRFPTIFTNRDALARSFRYFDLDRNGVFDVGECSNALKQSGHKTATKREVELLLSRFDKDKSGALDITEFFAIANEMAKDGKELGAGMKSLGSKSGCSLQ